MKRERLKEADFPHFEAHKALHDAMTRRTIGLRTHLTLVTARDVLVVPQGLVAGTHPRRGQIVLVVYVMCGSEVVKRQGNRSRGRRGHCRGCDPAGPVRQTGPTRHSKTAGFRVQCPSAAVRRMGTTRWPGAASMRPARRSWSAPSSAPY